MEGPVDGPGGRPVEGPVDGPVEGVAVDCGFCAASPVKSEPRIRSTVPGARLDTCRDVTLVSSFSRVFTAGMSAAVEYSMTDLVYAKFGASPVPVTLKPRLVSPAAASLATRETPEPFSTSTLTLPGLVVRTWAPPEDAGVVETFGTVTSLAMALNTWPACGCMGWTRLASCAHFSFGIVMNWTFWPDRLRKLCPISTRSDTVMPASVVIEAAASLTIRSSLIGLDSRPLCSTPLTTWADMNWSRWIRCRSEPSPRSSRVRQKASAWMPEMCCSPVLEVEAGHRVLDVERHADVNAAQVVDDLDEAEHADSDEVVDADAGHLLDRLPQAGRPADLEQRVDLHGAARVGLLAGVAGTAVTLIHRHHGVARDADHGELVPSG